MRPKLISGKPNLASSLTTIKSHPKEISKPPPKAAPLTAANIGFLVSYKHLSKG